MPILDYTKPASFGSLEIRPSERTEFIGQQADYSETGTTPTPLVSIDSLKLARVDLIKIDVEGMELEVLEGARESIQAYQPSLLIEAIKSSANGIAAFLKRLGYQTTPAGLNLLAVHGNDPLVALLGRKD